MPHRIPFDPKRPLVAARAFRFAGTDYEPGQVFAPEGADARLLRRQYEARAVNHGEPAESATTEADADPVQMTGPKGGRYTITAPWLAEPEVVRGKKPAEDRLAEIRAEGAPLGFIEGGSEVTVEEQGGGWYAVNAPWLEEPEKVQGREAAEARQLELHTAGAPDTGGQQDVQTEGGQPEESDVDDSNKNGTENLNQPKPEDGDKPNEPGTNQPNGAEVINDQKAATDGNARDSSEGENESTRPVGP